MKRERGEYLKEYAKNNKERIKATAHKETRRLAKRKNYLKPLVKLRHKTYNQLRYAIIKGIVIKPSICEVNNKECGGRLEAHHNDYNKPLEVKWLCDNHHKELHQNLKDKKYE